MEPNPYEAPRSHFGKPQPRMPITVPSQWWFWIALLLLAIAVMIVNQVGVMRAMYGRNSATPTATP